MLKRHSRTLVLFALVLAIAATVLFWNSADTTSEAGCLTCVTNIDCSGVFPGTTCNKAQGCTCKFVPDCGQVVCAN